MPKSDIEQAEATLNTLFAEMVNQLGCQTAEQLFNAATAQINPEGRVNEMNNGHQPKRTGPIGPPPQGGSSIERQSSGTSYATPLKNAGLFELHEKVTLKVKVIEALTEAARANLQVHDELHAVIRSLLVDLDLYTSSDAQNSTVERL